MRCASSVSPSPYEVKINYIYVCVEHAVILEINNFYLCISISENTTGGLILAHNSVCVPS